MIQEVVFSYKTRGNSSPKDKPRVYFTCHPEDFERYFEKICGDIFKTHDCAIYYTEDMNADLSNENNQVDLERMNLLVISVTFRLLTQPNRAMDSDFRFAMEKHIPVLPMMMEPGIDEFYSKQDKFGELQYIDPFNNDITAISYEEKLEKYLESILISDELAQRVRRAFDAYIFLSYRKKDRAYANELMKLIHKNPECRDIAIWFDEFLTPGESFKENIDRILQNSEMFALLVTPSLLEKPDGKPNFVMAEEYPAARDSGKEVLPAEMEQTDRFTLSSSFKELPECVDARNDKEFRERLLESLKRVAISENNNDPEHNYLIGLAYLEGIDVEKNCEKAIELILAAAESGLLEAMEKLATLYKTGAGYNRDYEKSVFWQEKASDYYYKQYAKAETEIIFKRLNDSKSAAFNTSFFELQDIVFSKSICFEMLNFIEIQENHACKGHYIVLWNKNLSAVFEAENDYSNAKKYLLSCVDNAAKIAGATEKSIDWLYLAQIYCSLGRIDNLMLNNNKLALEEYEKSLYILKYLYDINPDDYIAINIAYVYEQQAYVLECSGVLEEALQLYKKSKIQYEAIRYTEITNHLSQIYERIGQCCVGIGLIDEARDAFIDSYNFEKEVWEKNQNMPSFRHLGACFINLGDICEDYDSKKNCYLESLKIAKRLISDVGTIEAWNDYWVSLSKMGQLEYEFKNYSDAGEFFSLALDVAKKACEFTEGLGITFYNALNDLATSYFNISLVLQNANKSIEAARNAYEIWNELSSRFPMSKVYAERRDMVKDAISNL